MPDWQIACPPTRLLVPSPVQASRLPACCSAVAAAPVLPPTLPQGILFFSKLTSLSLSLFLSDSLSI